MPDQGVHVRLSASDIYGQIGVELHAPNFGSLYEFLKVFLKRDSVSFLYRSI